MLGPCKVIPQEYPNITCRSIDVVIPKFENQKEKLIDQLINEVQAQETDLVIAYRGHHRWIQTFKAVHLDETVEEMRLRDGGIYLIVGDLVKGLGPMFVEYLAQIARAKLILIGNLDIPERHEWEQPLEELGTEFLMIEADVANEKQMQAAINQAYERFGQIHGVFYSTPMSN